MNAKVLVGDCRAVMATLDAESLDAIVTDPPYELGFMGKRWDSSGVAFDVETWKAALRVAKPGAHVVAFGGTRGHHRMMCAIEDAGWEIRDCLMWLYGSGFPKSLDVSKAIDKAAGATREITGPQNGGRCPGGDDCHCGNQILGATRHAPATAPAKQWDGWGTALKPAYEPIILARKPFPSTVAANVLEHGTGALNIDGTRIRFASQADQAAAAAAAQRAGRDQNDGRTAYGRFENGEASIAPYLARMDGGRWPANITLDNEAASDLDAQSGPSTSRAGSPRSGTNGNGWGMTLTGAEYDDFGGASRFFYTAKASRAERNAGLEDIAPKQRDEQRDVDLPGGNNPRNRGAKSVANSHPTVKPLDLMQWLCRLVTPKGGLILDPFCGSGSTGRAAVAEGFRFVGIDLTEEYAVIARARIADYAPLFAEGE